MAAAPLLSTKYARPPLPSTSVERPSLFAGLAEPRALALVSAPPGYGKTTLVAGWLASEGRPAGWLTLDESDNDPAAFLAYLVAAIRRALPALDPTIDDLVSSLPSSAASLTPLLNGIGEVGEPFVIVLDDYHLVTSPDVHGIVGYLVGHLPANVRVVVVTRHDPPLPLARLRARGQLTEIRAARLRFGVEDARRIPRRRHGSPGRGGGGHAADRADRGLDRRPPARGAVVARSRGSQRVRRGVRLHRSLHLRLPDRRGPRAPATRGPIVPGGHMCPRPPDGIAVRRPHRRDRQRDQAGGARRCQPVPGPPRRPAHLVPLSPVVRRPRRLESLR